MVPKGIVALGASAGGLQALQDFFEHMPVDSGLAFVVIQHLSPNHKSLMPELLARVTAMPIHRVEEGLRLEANAIYLIPPKSMMTVDDWQLHLADQGDGGGSGRLPIDVFMFSLAEVHGPNACAIILSGTGSDGSRGIKAVHESGGMVLIQNIDSAEFDGMPHAAMLTHVADHVLPPSAMPEILAAWIRHGHVPISSAGIDPLAKVLERLEEFSGIDFSGYKQSTVRRRIERRMGFKFVENLADYMALLSGDEDECHALLHDLLIGVTGFLRDPEAFEALVPLLGDLIHAVAESPDREEVRVWVAGCATGEEAYSVAMLLQREIEAAGYPDIRARLFATDVHKGALAVASAGVYPLTALESLSPVMRDRWFIPIEGGKARVRQSLRDMIVFAPHNILIDPPFTGLDLVTCRNMLIYFDPSLQQYVLSMFQHALHMGGVLFLGASEGVGNFQEDFAVRDQKWKQFVKVRNRSLPLKLGAINAPASRIGTAAQSVTVTSAMASRDSRRVMQDYDQILRQCDLVGVLVDEFRKPIHVFGRAGEFFRVANGRYEDDVLNLLIDDLRLAVGTLLQKSLKTRLASSAKGVRATQRQEEVYVDISVTLSSGAAGDDHFLIVFKNIRPAQLEADVVDTAAVSSDIADGDKDEEGRFLASDHYHQRIKDLEQELSNTRESLQATVEELQTTNEELQSTNEELQAANEEMQSANEELHSVNEELYTVNSEFEQKNAELIRVNKDHESLLGSLDTGTVFLDRELCIRKFNDAVQGYFNLLKEDIGRPLSHIAFHLDTDEDIGQQARAVLATGEISETEIRSRAGRWLWKRMIPFRREDGSIDGVIITFTDVTDLRVAQAEATSAVSRYETILTNCADGVVLAECSSTDRSWVLSEANARAASLLHLDSLKAGDDLLAAMDHLSSEEGDVGGMIEGVIAGTQLFCVTQGDHADWLEVQVVRAGPLLGVLLRDRSAAIEERLQLASERDSAAAQNALKTRFLATISHELRTPLNGVIGAADLLGTVLVGTEHHDLLETIELSAAHLLSIIDDMLDITRIENGGMSLHDDVFDLVETAEVAAAIFGCRAFDKGLDFTIRMGHDLPVMVRGDRTRIIQLIANLLGNAIKYTDEGSVRLFMQSVPMGVEIKVQDTGVGIALADQEHVLKPFFQVGDHVRRNNEGIGLGLSICQQIVEAMGGVLLLNSDIGAGTLVTIHLPLQGEEHDAVEPGGSGRRVGVIAPLDLNQEIGFGLEASGLCPVNLSPGRTAAQLQAMKLDALIIDADLLDSEPVVSDQDFSASLPLIAVATPKQFAATRRLHGHSIVRPVRRRHLSRLFASLFDPQSSMVSRHPQHGLRILLVEDNTVNQKLLQMQLGQLGCTVIIANDGIEAVTIAREEHFDLTLMDLQMPRCDGFEATRLIRQIDDTWRSAPIYALTASTLASDDASCIAAGIDRVLTKPIAMNEFDQILQQVQEA